MSKASSCRASFGILLMSRRSDEAVRYFMEVVNDAVLVDGDVKLARDFLDLFVCCVDLIVDRYQGVVIKDRGYIRGIGEELKDSAGRYVQCVESMLNGSCDSGLSVRDARVRLVDAGLKFKDKIIRIPSCEFDGLRYDFGLNRGELHDALLSSLLSAAAYRARTYANEYRAVHGKSLKRYKLGEILTGLSEDRMFEVLWQSSEPSEFAIRTMLNRYIKKLHTQGLIRAVSVDDYCRMFVSGKVKASASPGARSASGSSAGKRTRSRKR